VPETPLRLNILHTNDFHNALTEAGAARLQQAVSDLNGAPYLLLDAGDAIKAGNVGFNPFGEPILDRMSDLGYHAMTMGNRESHFRNNILEIKLNRARFPVLCANLRARSSGVKLPVASHAEFTIGGLKVAVFGVTIPMVTAKQIENPAVAVASDFVYDSPIATAREMVAKLRWNADVLIALTHIGLREDQKLARDVSGIDLIVGGHSHITLTEPEMVNGTPIVQTGCYAHAYGHVTLEVAADGNVCVAAASLHPLQEGTRK